jgi:DNA-binding NarL/FixJ family response regulator
MPPSLLRKGFSSLLLDFGYQLQSSHSNGKEMIASLSADDLPHIVLIDVDRQETPAVETTAWLREHHPSIKVLALCMDAEESKIKPMLESGAAGYILKWAEPSQIKDIIWYVHTKGYYVPLWKHQS